mgnify:CR=1 FL=1
MRIHADLASCQGYGNCAGTDGKHFDLDDDGFVVIRSDRVTAEDNQSVAEAVRSCPAEAIWLVADDD